MAPAPAAAPTPAAAPSPASAGREGGWAVLTPTRPRARCAVRGAPRPALPRRRRSGARTRPGRSGARLREQRAGLGLAHRVARPSLGEGDNRPRRGERLDGDDAEVVDGRVDDRLRRGVEPVELRVADAPAQLDGGAGERGQPLARGAVADDDPARPPAGEGADRELDALVGDQRRDAEVRRLASAGAGGRAIGNGREPARVDGRLDDRGLAAVVAADAIARVAAVGDEGVRPRRGGDVPAPQPAG